MQVAATVVCGELDSLLHGCRINYDQFFEGLWHNFDLFEQPTEFDSLEEHEAKQKAAAELKFKELDVDRCGRRTRTEVSTRKLLTQHRL